MARSNPAFAQDEKICRVANLLRAKLLKLSRRAERHHVRWKTDGALVRLAVTADNLLLQRKAASDHKNSFLATCSERVEFLSILETIIQETRIDDARGGNRI